LRSEPNPNPDGHHRRVYAARFGGLTVDLDDGEFGIEVDREEDTADRFTRLWRDLR
jgi:hypothetical protein